MAVVGELCLPVLQVGKIVVKSELPCVEATENFMRYDHKRSTIVEHKPVTFFSSAGRQMLLFYLKRPTTRPFASHLFFLFALPRFASAE